MADNCLSLDPWAFRPAPSTFPDSLWSITESFSRDNDALAKALQISLSDNSSASDVPAGSIPDTRPAPKPAETRNPLSCSPSARISKRKSRASKKSPTTYITADPANFRQMVQQVTGARFGAPGQVVPVEAAVLPYPQRGGVGGGSHRGLVQVAECLPTLDTSAVLLDRARMAGGSIGPVEAVASSVFDFEAGFSSFPTLESWGAISIR